MRDYFDNLSDDHRETIEIEITLEEILYTIRSDLALILELEGTTKRDITFYSMEIRTPLLFRLESYLAKETDGFGGNVDFLLIDSIVYN